MNISQQTKLRTKYRRGSRNCRITNAEAAANSVPNWQNNRHIHTRQHPDSRFTNPQTIDPNKEQDRFEWTTIRGRGQGKGRRNGRGREFNWRWYLEIKNARSDKRYEGTIYIEKEKNSDSAYFLKPLLRPTAKLNKESDLNSIKINPKIINLSVNELNIMQLHYC